MNLKNEIKEFLSVRDMAELKALSSLSLEQQLTNKQFNRIMELKKRCLEID